MKSEHLGFSAPEGRMYGSDPQTFFARSSQVSLAQSYFGSDEADPIHRLERPFPIEYNNLSKFESKTMMNLSQISLRMKLILSILIVVVQ
jgi:hypothetical protein